MPYCPDCLQEQHENLARCPLDRAFYVEVQCPHCGCEVLPRENYCAGCGKATAGFDRQQVVSMSKAGRGRRLSAGLVDLLVLLLGVEMLRDSGVAASLAMVVGCLAGLSVLYGSLFQSGGRQTFGQALTGLMALDSSRQPLTFKGAGLRSLLQLAWWATLLLPLLGAADFPARVSASQDYRVGD